MSERAYTFDHVDAAMCIIEEIVSPCLATTPWEKYRDQVGIAYLRAVVLDRLAWPCHEAWGRAYARYEATEDDQHDDTCEAGGGTGVCTCGAAAKNDPGSFDYEFVPFWIRECVDWSDVLNGPRVKGSK